MAPTFPWPSSQMKVTWVRLPTAVFGLVWGQRNVGNVRWQSRRTPLGKNPPTPTHLCWSCFILCCQDRVNTAFNDVWRVFWNLWTPKKKCFVVIFSFEDQRGTFLQTGPLLHPSPPPLCWVDFAPSDLILLPWNDLQVRRGRSSRSDVGAQSEYPLCFSQPSGPRRRPSASLRPLQFCRHGWFTRDQQRFAQDWRSRVEKTWVHVKPARPCELLSWVKWFF